ncbi:MULTISPECIES: DUF2913 family protein [Rahnella]|uniref:DUF2913 family protein n=1 Tax=Rahnella laticis TaxID=2787622 RepID=A0ABS0E295_9GAMM|nr:MULTISPECIES: DUF2913 family protein [Rahnella]MBF7979208.1 DUF2913 family protein [Rahnella laticis]MBF7999527.1 DUF2913 family protein [Rahnella sp. LAC-M12]
MKKAPPSVSPEHTVADLAHFAWCGLVALRTAQQDGQAGSPLAAHTFLLRWLAVAQKQKRFPRTVAPDIAGLLALGRKKGIAASLFNRLEYLWTSCTGPVPAQSDLYRLTYAIEQLKSQGWINAVINDDDWDEKSLSEDYGNSVALLVKKSALTCGFSDDGKLVEPVEFRVLGDMSACIDAFQTHVLQVAILGSNRITLLPE